MASDDWKTIRVPGDAYSEAKTEKEERGVTWGEYLRPGEDHEPYAEVAVDMDASTVRGVVSDEIQKHLSEITVNVDMDGLDLDGSGMDENDVRNIVESKLEKTFGDRLPQ